MAKQSAGVLLYRKSAKGVEVLIVHPGGPFWAKKDAGVWSIPKGEFGPDEDPSMAAKREFSEELGSPPPDGEYISLGSAKQSSGKVVHAWAAEAEFNVTKLKSNTFMMEWPPKSGKQLEIPEVDRAAWVSLEAAQTKLLKGQLPLLEALAKHLGKDLTPPEQSAAQISLF